MDTQRNDSETRRKRRKGNAKLILALYTPQNYATVKAEVTPEELAVIDKGIAWAKEVLKQGS